MPRIHIAIVTSLFAYSQIKIKAIVLSSLLMIRGKLCWFLFVVYYLIKDSHQKARTDFCKSDQVFRSKF